MQWRVLTRFRFGLQFAMDAIAWCAALILATVLRDEFQWIVPLFDILLVGAVASALQLLVGTRFGLYVHRWRYGAFEEIGGLGRTVAVVTAVTAVVNRLALGHRIPISASLMAGPLALLFMAGARFGWRVLIEKLKRPDGVGAKRVVVFGAGEGGMQVIRAMATKSSPYYPVAIIDDNPRFKNLQIKGVRVRGDRTQMVKVAREYDAEILLVAIPSASGALLRELSALAHEAKLKVMVLPPVAELFGVGVGVADIRPLTEEDILGRRVLDTDIEAVAGYLTGKRVLVTGAGGSIGSELCRQINRFAPESLVMLDRDESGLQAVQLSIEGHGLLDRDELVVADIRDLARMQEVFATFRPEVVFHAAALKHLTLLEHNPDEGYKTNVVGTQHLLEVAGQHRVEVFVNISTDKAADATSVLGRTKRMAEQLTAKASRLQEGRYLSVRFGNVLGSRGSMLPLFRTQIDQGGPVTVTHPDVTRYFMTIPRRASWWSKRARSATTAT